MDWRQAPPTPQSSLLRLPTPPRRQSPKCWFLKTKATGVISTLGAGSSQVRRQTSSETRVRIAKAAPSGSRPLMQTAANRNPPSSIFAKTGLRSISNRLLWRRYGPSVTLADHNHVSLGQFSYTTLELGGTNRPVLIDNQSTPTRSMSIQATNCQGQLDP